MPELDVEVLLLGPPGLQISYLCAFSSGGYVKYRVYKTPVNDMDHLKEKIREAVASVSRIPFQTGLFKRKKNSDSVEVFR